MGYTPPPSTTTISFDQDAYEKTWNYTLCWDALSYYNMSDPSEVLKVDPGNSAWWSEYDRVCLLDLDSPLPTSAFNTSIVVDIQTNAPPTRTASAGASSTTPSASAISTPTSSISLNDLCGGEHGYTCKGSQFGGCCSKYGR